jgi:hypothetical protein
MSDEQRNYLNREVLGQTSRDQIKDVDALPSRG